MTLGTAITLDQDDMGRALVERRKLGAYYTPLYVTTLLAKWSIRDKSDLILEPCFGGCTFLDAALTQLKILGNANPIDNLFGCDIDSVAFTYLQKRTKNHLSPRRFFKSDFMQLSPDQMHNKVDVVIGNPPYISYENLSDESRDFLREWRKTNASLLNGRASLWAYFVIHSLTFLRPGGRLALVLPGSLIYTAYGNEVRRILELSFEHSIGISLIQRLFIEEGTEESTVVVLCENYQGARTSASMSLISVNNVDELKLLLENRDLVKDLAVSPYLEHPTIERDPAILFDSVARDINAQKFSNFADVNIGLVTGDSKFFIKARSEWANLGISDRYLRYIMPRSQKFRGIYLSRVVEQAYIKEDLRCLALKVPKDIRSTKLKKYLDTYPLDLLQANSTFKKRPNWYDFYDDRIADAFLVFMTDRGPRLIVNESRAVCTNGYYKISLKKRNDLSHSMLAAISFQSTLTQFSAELVGAGRGAGALKLEPSKVKDLLVCLPKREEREIAKTFHEIDELHSQKRYDEAREHADRFLFLDSPAWDKIQILSSCLSVIRYRRNGAKQSSENGEKRAP